MLLSVLFLNHDFTKIQVAHPIILNLSLILFFTTLTLITLRKTIEDKPFSVLQTTQIKGVAILLVIIGHLGFHTIEKMTDLSFFMRIGPAALPLFLIVSGLGISSSLEKKGIKGFFSKRVTRVYLPVFLAMLLEIFLLHTLGSTENNLLVDIARIFYDLENLDRNMWFVIFIMFWYCMTYLVYWLNLSNTKKLIFLCSVSLIILSIPQVSGLWKANALSFPLGCWIGLNLPLITQQTKTLVTKKFVIYISLIVSCILLSKLIGYLANLHIMVVIILGSSLLAIGYTIYKVKRKIKLSLSTETIETVTLFSIITIIYLNCSHWFPEYSKYNVAKNIIENIYSISLAVAILLLITLMVKLKLYSYFLNFIGEVSFELYLLHGMFMYSFDFILFRGNLCFTFYIYFLALCITSMYFRRLNSSVYNSLVNLLETQEQDGKGHPNLARIPEPERDH
jgi:peptidoglycan/LPS O-acetylase OafA/YrhL